MVEKMRQIFHKWGLGSVLERYPELSIIPDREFFLTLRGTLSFKAVSDGYEEIEDAFQVKISVPKLFPKVVPEVWEIGGRIPSDFHQNLDRTLCLGSPLRLHSTMSLNPTLGGFIELSLIPYLYSRSYFERHKVFPFGELEHGSDGVLEDYQSLFKVHTNESALQMLFLLTLRNRVANKRPCPCGSGRRVGVCHHKVLNEIRKLQNREWFQREYQHRCPHQSSLH